MRVLITRSREDAEPLAARLADMGIASLSEPLLEIVFLPGPDIDMENVQALVMTSANGVRAFCARSDERRLPLFAVGDATARAAEAFGFAKVYSASGNVDALGGLIKEAAEPQAGALLHGAGSKVAGDLATDLEAAGYTYRREVLYEAKKATRLSDNTIQALAEKSLDGALFYSPRTAKAFVGLVRKAGLEAAAGSLVAYCLSSAVADKASALRWKDTQIAGAPEQESLLKVIGQSV